MAGTSKSADYYETRQKFETPTKVLILSKTTRLQYELSKHKLDFNSRHQEKFVQKLKKMGINMAEIEAKHAKQEEYVKDLKDELERRNIEVVVVLRNDYTQELVESCGLIISAGGDGTFLTAASKVKNNTPLIGINTDPIGSEGHLCITGKANVKAEKVIAKFLDNQFKWLFRQRIRVTILSTPNGSPPSTPSSILPFIKNKNNNNHTEPAEQEFLALNEVFIGETHAARVSYYELQIDDSPMLKQKSSGMTVCTGTGSTSWHYNINRINEQKMNGIFDVLKDMGVDLGTMNRDDLVENVCNKYNHTLIFDPSYDQMAFSVRDPVFNATFPHTESRGFCKSIRIKSRCTKAHIVLDGNQSINFNQGTEVLLEMHDHDELRTATMDPHMFK
uniref:NAD(+) kinase n=1 Tax=Rhabditophanes sp. KR3021 TaxID=114890 RepID=A0AC35TSL4_9BILA